MKISAEAVIAGIQAFRNVMNTFVRDNDVTFEDGRKATTADVVGAWDAADKPFERIEAKANEELARLEEQRVRDSNAAETRPADNEGFRTDHQ